MLRYLHILYMDGEKERVPITDDIGAVRVKDGVLVVRGGDGSYATRGDVRGFPLENVRRYWTSDHD